jgi:hypothetical protein
MTIVRLKFIGKGSELNSSDFKESLYRNLRFFSRLALWQQELKADRSINRFERLSVWCPRGRLREPRPTGLPRELKGIGATHEKAQ